MENLKKTTKVKKVEKVYSYFVSYDWDNGVDVGSGHLIHRRNTKIKNSGDFMEMREALKKEIYHPVIVIMNFILFEE